MKKVLTIALVMCLVLGAAFAAKGDIKVGGQLGYVGGFATEKLSQDSDYLRAKISVGGFGFEITGLYGVTDEISVKAALGLAFFGKATTRTTICVGGNVTNLDPEKDDKSSPMKFSMYCGGQYAFEVSKEIKVAAGAGLDMAIGKESTADDAKTLFSLGLGAEVTGSYAINKNLDVLLGARYSLYFINSSESLKEAREDAKELGAKLSFNSSALRIFAGCTYAF